MSLLGTLATLLPVGASVSIVLAAMKRDDVGAILRVATRNLVYLVLGLVSLAIVVQILAAIFA